MLFVGYVVVVCQVVIVVVYSVEMVEGLVVEVVCVDQMFGYLVG